MRGSGAPSESADDPTGLATSAIGNNTATVSWTAVANALSYAIDYKLNTTTTWTSFSTAQTATSANLTGLTQGSLYDWRVKATCAAGSGNSVAAQFTTTAPFTCNAPSGLTASSITSSGATVGWTAVSGAASYAVEYKLSTVTTWTSAATATTATSVAIGGLTASSLYDYRVSTNCGANGTSGFAAAQFTTAAAGCQSVYDVTSNGTTGGAASIPFNTNITGLISPSGDIDNYQFVITTGGTIILTLGALPADYDLKLLNSAGTQLAISSNSRTNSETINYTAAAGTYYAQVYPFKNNSNATSCYTLKVALGTAARSDEIVSVNSGKKGVTVFPNPAKDKLNINISGYPGAAEISIFSGTSQKVITHRTGQNNSVLDISKLTRGVYLVKIITANGEVLNQKIIKQ